ncbi:leucyl aminopeptidase [Rhodospirillum rubrum]|uniref:leucyl aminopeptidase family protein n=1 Tax=Rhodospirillum rubrum TaxID=1085 RepID=UPI00190405A6|nr:leucyl aminopeptidase family protein [Rhodospirillum rubrum]MBK1664794.1 leucyl aminopeptidase [Rhodospirillum rubrum]MBK1676698.1 leucyl aminopeptidase [Rhodospirillum rubrum]
MLDTLILAAAGGAPIPLHPVTKAGCKAWLAGLDAKARRWAEAQGFDATQGAVLSLPAADGAIAAAAVGLGEGDDPFAFSSAASALPPGDYRLETASLPAGWAAEAALAWALAAYRFGRYRPSLAEGPRPRLVWPVGADRARVERLITAIGLVRDLVNTPAEDMGPAELAKAAGDLAAAHGATLSVIVGEELRTANYPLIHAVGRASSRAPRLIDLTWGDPGHPGVTLVGKGVCFDSGGLDLKPSAGMRLMKKDMGGAAHVLGLAALIMGQKLPVRLRVLIPAVDNAVAGNAFRPGDILTARNGLSVEIGNTDAEGRLVLADALAEACAGAPDLLIDCATLTGAARVALGPDLPALFCDDDALVEDLLAQTRITRDPLWRMPLWAPYRRMLDSKVADLTNAPDGSFAGAITAALFLKAFVDPEVRWLHLDLFAWQPAARPGRPEGGAAQGLRALFGLIETRFGR